MALHFDEEKSFDPSLEMLQTENQAVDFRGRPVDKSKTGLWKGAIPNYGIAGAESLISTGISLNLVTYLVTKLHFNVSDASNVANNWTGTCYLLPLLGGFIADSSIGRYRTILISSVLLCLGLGFLTFTTAYKKWEPAYCVPTATISCPKAGSKILTPLFFALYILALGSGGIKPNSSAFGASQFDESIPAEKQQSNHYFNYYYFSLNFGALISITALVYLQTRLNQSWGYGVMLILGVLFSFVFLLGTPWYRHEIVSGSPLTRMAQVVVAALRKSKLPAPADANELYEVKNTSDNESAIRGSRKLAHTRKLSFLDKAAVISRDDRNDLESAGTVSRWHLCTVTQVEEFKRIVLVLPVWIPTWAVYVIYAQLSTFTVEQASTMDRHIGPNFEVPAASLFVFVVFFNVVFAMLYDRFVVPALRRFTGHPRGLPPLFRTTLGIGVGVLMTITVALVERKRLTYVRKLGLENLPLGTFGLPMKMWWILPQSALYSILDILVIVAQLEFFYAEVSDGMRSMGTSFSFTAVAMGQFLSTVLVRITNRVTRHQPGGSWLVGQLNNGGLEKFFWMLSVLIAVVLVVFIICAHFYEYNPVAGAAQGSTRPVSDHVSTDGEELKTARLSDAQRRKVFSEPSSINDIVPVSQ